MTTPANPDDLLAFVRAQLDADERVAREAEDSTNLSHGEWPFWIDVDDDFAMEAAQAWRDRFHPARALVEVDAKRRILDAYQPGEHDDEIRFGDWRACSDECAFVVMDEVVKLLALPYAGRPGYREEWRP